MLLHPAGGAITPKLCQKNQSDSICSRCLPSPGGGAADSSYRDVSSELVMVASSVLDGKKSWMLETNKLVLHMLTKSWPGSLLEDESNNNRGECVRWCAC